MKHGGIQWAVVLVVVLSAVVVGAGLSAAGSPELGLNTFSEQAGTATTAPPERMTGNLTNTTTQSGATAWPMAGVDAANTRHLDTTGPTKPLNVRWQFRTKDELFTRSVVANGTIYFGGIDTSCTPDPRGKRNPECRHHKDYIYAVDAKTGEERWRLSLGNTIIQTPAVVNKTVYVPTTGRLFALDADTGIVRWHAKAPRSPPVVVDGTVYVGKRDGAFAFDSSTGEVRWSLEDPGKLAVADGTVYLIDGHEVEARNAQTGDLRWTAEVGGGLERPTVAHGLVYVGSDKSNTMYALDAQTGNEQWKLHIEGDPKDIDEVAAGRETIYFGTKSGKLHAVDAKTGNRRWSVRKPNNTPVLVNGIAYVAHGRSVYALNAENGNEVARFTVDDPDARISAERFIIPPQATVVDGNVYIAYTFGSHFYSNLFINDTRLYALGSPAFSYSNLSISPRVVAPGKPVTVTATVKNTGTAPGALNATLVVDGTVVSAGKATLDVGASRTVQFNHVFRKTGTYAIGINQLSQTITVTSNPQQSPTPTKTAPTPTGGDGKTASSPTATQPPTATDASTPGFGAGAVVLALLVANGLLGRKIKQD